MQITRWIEEWSDTRDIVDFLIFQIRIKCVNNIALNVSIHYQFKALKMTSTEPPILALAPEFDKPKDNKAHNGSFVASS